MNVRKSDDFIADIERQFNWHGANAGCEIADCFLEAGQAMSKRASRLPPSRAGCA